MEAMERKDICCSLGEIGCRKEKEDPKGSFVGELLEPQG